MLRRGIIAALGCIAIGQSVLADCAPTGPRFSTPGYVTSLPESADARNLRGAFWALGSGDPEIGLGRDNGTWAPVVDPSYGYFGWAYSTGLPDQPVAWPMYVRGTWGTPPDPGASIDGCILEASAEEPACMALLLADHAPDCDPMTDMCVSFAFATAALEGEDYVFHPSDGQDLQLRPLPRATYSSILDDLDTAQSEFEFAPLGLASLEGASHLDPACDSGGIAGYRVYQTMSPSLSLALSSGTWQLAVGGAGDGGAPIPLDQGTTIRPGCSYLCGVGGSQSCPAFAYSLVFDDGFELPYLSLLQNTAGYFDGHYADRFLCCEDSDADGFCVYNYDLHDVDCDDDDPLTYPRAPETCDGVARDCTDPDWPAPTSTSDLDGDGWCGDDCDDRNAAVYPGAPDPCDGLYARDCNAPGWPSPLDAIDHDGDGFSICSGDCNEYDAAVYPGAPEVCDGLTNDCNADPWQAVNLSRCDDDGDGFTEDDGDCDDTYAAVYPGAPEICDNIGNDCDAGSWPAEAGSMDQDGDGFRGCQGDCDDSAADVYPFAPEVCDGRAHDCNAPNWPEPPGTVDLDGDGFAPCDGDCDETRADVNPAAAEVCNGRDDDCSGRSDEAPTPIVKRHGDWNAGAHFGIRIARLNSEYPGGIYVVGARRGVVAGLQTGTATVFWGAGASSIRRISRPHPQAGDHFGSSVAGIGDIDGDGYRDILVGAEYDAIDGVRKGSAHVYSGAFPFLYVAELQDPDGGDGDRFGYNAAALGDLNGDGFDELIVGARGDDDARGSATVFSGADFSVLHKLTDPAGQAGDLFGYITAGVEDLNADGVPDILIGAYGADSAVAAGAGKVIAFSGADFASIRTFHDPSGASGDGFGRGLAVLGDVSGDAVADVLIGAPGKNQRGVVLLVSGADGAVLDQVVDDDGADGDLFGYHVATVGDLDQDGIPEFLVGAFDDDTFAGPHAGSVSMFFGATRGALGKFLDHDGAAFDLFGFSGTGIDDVDGDGIGEIVIGSYLDDRLDVQDVGSVTLLSGNALADIDGDGIGDQCDTDRDGDGHDNEVDCQPFDAELWRVPQAVGATLEWSSDKQVLWWQPVEQATRYRVYSAGVIQDGRFAYAPGDWFQSSVHSGNVSAFFTTGSGFYLVAAENGCGVSDLGNNSAGDVRALPGR